MIIMLYTFARIDRRLDNTLLLLLCFYLFLILTDAVAFRVPFIGSPKEAGVLTAAAVPSLLIYQG